MRLNLNSDQVIISDRSGRSTGGRVTGQALGQHLKHLVFGTPSHTRFGVRGPTGQTPRSSASSNRRTG